MVQVRVNFWSLSKLHRLLDLVQIKANSISYDQLQYVNLN